ncbi:hypothetical protein DFJ43DRAFT_1001247 [Lentinula guzmanii]|uniref:DDE-1 domain-containing protein n=1 Tax=Lentinula guzmanii TaxID=2804957 RepID=A0AA38JGJ5_9AGAR|nr:hypothetical protein DFJ43DRAFT_1001247 [Lentinula guzmanii]
MSDLEDSNNKSDKESVSDHDTSVSSSTSPVSSFQQETESLCLRVQTVPIPKRRKLDIPVRELRAKAKEKRAQEFLDAFTAIHKLLNSKRAEFEAGPHSLQARRAHAIHGLLLLVVKRNESFMAASKMSAATHGFSPEFGSRLLRGWTREWIRTQSLPSSWCGSHAKVFSMLSDPTLRAEIRSYLRSNKWSTNPEKLQSFINKEMLPEAAKEYAQQISGTEMPEGLKKYLELELFPRIGLKVKHGICKSTAHALLIKEASWVFKGEHAIRKKGVGRGIHQSDIICSTFGWLREASETLEYGKNNEGFWNGELFIKQLTEKIIPTFERLHGKNFQAVFLIDNSQGHSAYAVDALLVSRMNFNSGGKQARMRNGWYEKDGEHITQSMNFPPNHPHHPNEPKGMKVFFWGAVKRYLRDHCDYTFVTLKANMPKAMESVGLETIRKWEHRTHRWISAYRDGLDAKDAQDHVRAFSSRKYKSHRRVPERLAQSFDA